MKTIAAICILFLLHIGSSPAFASNERLKNAAKGVDETVRKVDLKQALDELSVILEIEPDTLVRGLDQEWTISGLAAVQLIAKKTEETVETVLARIPNQNWLAAIEAAEIPEDTLMDRFDDLHAELAFMALDWRDGSRRGR